MTLKLIMLSTSNKKKFDTSKAQTGMIDLMEAHTFIKSIIPKAEMHAESSSPE